MTSPLMMALESEATGKAIEIEYSYFILLNNEQLRTVLSRLYDCKHYCFYEGKLAYNKDTSASSRIRHYIRGDEETYELTTKYKTGESLAKVESNIELDDINCQQLKLLTTSSCVRVRIEIPVKRTDGTVVMRGEKPLVWELDLYIDASTTECTSFHPWAKVELEVDSATLSSVVDYIPFEYDSILSSDTNDSGGRAFIDNLYQHEYNTTGKVFSMSGIDDIIALT